MNETPRTLNRILLAIIGLVLMCMGVLAIALAMIPAARPWWQQLALNIQDGIGELFAQTTLAGQRDSWLWIVVAVLTIALLVGMVAWAVNQGKGRTGAFVGDFGAEREDGRVLITGSVPEQALKAALAERGDLVSSTVTTLESGGRAGVRIRVLPRPGVPAYLLAEELSELVLALDTVVGARTPVLISIGAGPRSRFVRAERVR